MALAAFITATRPTVVFAIKLVEAGDEDAEMLLRRLAEQVADANLDAAKETATELAGYCLQRQSELAPDQAAVIEREEAERVQRHVAAFPQAAHRIEHRRSKIATARRRYEAREPGLVSVLLTRARSALPGRPAGRSDPRRARAPDRPRPSGDDDELAPRRGRR